MLEARSYLEHWMEVTTSYGQGEYDSPNYLEEYAIALCLLVTAGAWAEPNAAEPRDGGTPLVFSAGGLDLGPSTKSWWGGCYLAISAKGNVRIEGTPRQRCIEALQDAVRLAEAEEAVNAGIRRKRSRRLGSAR